MGLFSFIGGILGGGAQKKASNKATVALTDAYNRGIDEQHRQYDLTRSDFAPYTKAGNTAIEALSSLINGDDPAALTARIKGNPLYDAMYRNGEEALLQNASATGGLRGGDTQRGLADFGSDTLARVYDIIKGDLGNLANLGLGATGSVAGFGQNTANNVTSLLGQIGGAKANNFLAKGRINAQNWSSAGSFLDDIASSFIPGGGGASGGLGKALSSIF